MNIKEFIILNWSGGRWIFLRVWWNQRTLKRISLISLRKARYSSTRVRTTATSPRVRSSHTIQGPPIRTLTLIAACRDRASRALTFQRVAKLAGDRQLSRATQRTTTATKARLASKGKASQLRAAIWPNPAKALFHLLIAKICDPAKTC